MDDKPFRVLFDVKDLYLEDIEKIWIKVSPSELETIYDLKMYILHRINLEQNVQFFFQDGLLLDDEPSDILRDGDTVKIKYKTSVCRNVQKNLPKSVNFSRKRNHDERINNDEDINSKRYRPITACSSSNITIVQETSIKEKNKQSKPPINVRDDHSRLEDDNLSHKKSNKKENEVKSSAGCDQIVTESEKTVGVFSEEPTSSKEDELNFHQNKSSEDATTAVNSSESSRNNQSERKCEKDKEYNRKEICPGSSCDPISDLKSFSGNYRSVNRNRVLYIRPDLVDAIFSSDSNPNLKSFSKNVDKSVNRKYVPYLKLNKNKGNCNLNDVEIHNPSTDSCVPKEDKLTDVPSEYCPIMPTPAQSSNCSVPDLQLSVASENSNLLPYDNAGILEKSSKKYTLQSNKENESQQQFYESYPDVTTLPLEGVCLAYKMFELNEYYAPVLSEYKVGVVRRCLYSPLDEDDKVEIQIIKDPRLSDESQKFENLGIDEVPEPVQSYDVLTWAEIFSPKKLSHLPQ